MKTCAALSILVTLLLPCVTAAGDPAGRPAVQQVAQAGTEMETYEGRLASGDVAFRLHLFKGTRATAEWERSVGGATRYEGSYSGSDGNYAVKLEAAPGSESGAPSPLHLTLRSLGGMVSATYKIGDSQQARNAAGLKLMGVSTPSVKLRGKPAGQSSAQGVSGNRGRQGGSRQGSGRVGSQRGRIGTSRNTPGRGAGRNRRVIVVPGIRR